MRVGLVPLAAKPYHAGHHALVEKAAKENDAVWLFTTISDRKRKGEFPISGQAMLQIWENQLRNAMPKNVIIEYVKSPVRAVFEKLIEAEARLDPRTTYKIYSDPTDTRKNYTVKMRQKHFPNLIENGKCRFRAEEDPDQFTRGIGMPNISGTRMRKFLKNENYNEFAQNLPRSVDATTVWNLLKNNSETEDLIRACIKSFITG